jgi:tRNA A37 threonylcarbamoyladenosine synthetase subunit TsaC/SUA5/YrdC
VIIKKNKFKKIRDLYRDGKVLVIPADTVFGLTCLINNVKATKSIFRIKRRSHLKPLPILFAN